MEQLINHYFTRLKLVFLAFWLLVIGLWTAFETDCIPQGIWVGDARLEFMGQYLSFLSMLALVPLALWLFGRRVKNLRKAAPDAVALRGYLFWSTIRLLLLLLPIAVNLAVYYFTLNTSGLLCLAIGIIAVFFCVPGKRKMMDELTLSD